MHNKTRKFFFENNPMGNARRYGITDIIVRKRSLLSIRKFYLHQR